MDQHASRYISAAQADGYIRPKSLIINNIRPLLSTGFNICHSSIEFSMVLLAVVAALLFTAPSIATSPATSLSGAEKVACSKLKSKYSDSTFSPGSSGYSYETQERMTMLSKFGPILTNDSQHTGQPRCTAALHAFSFHKMPSKLPTRSPQ